MDIDPNSSYSKTTQTIGSLIAGVLTIIVAGPVILLGLVSKLFIPIEPKEMSEDDYWWWAIK